MGLGTIGGFKLQLEDRGGLGYEALYAATRPRSLPGVADARARRPVHELPDQRAAALCRHRPRQGAQLGVTVTDIFDTMQIYLGSLYVNDFNRFGRTYQVRRAGRRAFPRARRRHRPAQDAQRRGEMVPLGALLKVTEAAGPNAPCATTASCPPTSTAAGAGLARARRRRRSCEKLLARPAAGIAFEWTELTYQEILAGNTAVLIFPLCVLLVFLVLAAQYESLTLPLSIILIVPMCLLAAMTGVWLTARRQQHLHADRADRAGRARGKNAILIVEFARELEEGTGYRRGRARSLPAAPAADPDDLDRLHHGRGAAGAVDRRRRRDAPGDGRRVFSGMIGVTIFGLFLTPVFYVLLRALTGNRPLKQAGEVPPEEATPPVKVEPAPVQS
jgi:multidrug efflux pump